MENEGSTDRNAGSQHNNMVTSVGNAWVLSRSKSYAGRIYYFNTLTGEAVWNLSNEEIEKAKKLTAKLPLQPENFPEPQEPPMDHNNYDPSLNNVQQPVTHYVPPKVYNKRVVNNQFSTRPQFSQFVPSCSCPMNPLQNMVGIRPNVWVQPPQIFLTPPGSSMAKINQSTENVAHHNFIRDFTVQNTSLTLSRRFTFVNKRDKNFFHQPKGVGKFTPRNNNKFKRPFYPRRQQNQNEISDLRTILKAKKTVNETLTETPENNSNVNQDPTPIKTSQLLETPSPVESKTVEESLHANVDDEWLKNHGTIEGAKLKLNITSLRNLATENSDCECWYIVVDKNVLMNHFNFLNVLTTSDEQCKLMIVRDVMSELQAAARCSAAKDGARKVLRGLSHLFAVKLAVIAEYSFKPNELKNGIGMVNFCTMLQQQNEHVVLLSNEEGLQKHSSQVPTFTIQDVKDLILSDKCRDIKIMSPVIERSIKITIPNDTYEDDIPADEMDTAANSSLNSVQEFSPKRLSMESNTKETNVQTDDLIPAKNKMVDAEVQTDPIIQQDSIGVNTIESITNISNVETDTEKNTTSKNDTGTREIRLKRSLSNLTMRSNSNDIGKRQFKWHRKRRDGSIAFSDSTSSLDERVSRMSKLNETNAHPTRISNMVDVICQPRSQSTQMSYDDYTEGSETSSCVFMQRDATENILIEETSTSDVISNSVSNVDSESNQGVKNAKEIPNYRNDEEQNKNVMFEVTSKEMEQNLRVRRDEWLAEFNQIMEEVLTEILRRKSEHVKSMPPPWTLHEATECIKKTFIGDSDVFDAATKLSQVIHRMCDVKGKFVMNFNPSEFMELYSYGVYLVDSLQSILEKSEDLQIAAESLAKLLSDIENPLGEGGHNDSFGDTTEASVIISQSSTEVAPNQETRSVVSNKATTPQKCRKEVDSHSNTSSAKYNLRSNRKKKPDEVNVETPPVKFIRKVNIHDDFFTSLHLQRRDETSNANSKPIEDNSLKIINNITKNVSSNADKPSDKGPIVIRNFSRCPEFEETLKSKSSFNDYNDFDFGNMEGDYEEFSDDYDQDLDFGAERTDDWPDNSDFIEKLKVDANNNDFKVLVRNLIDEIRETTTNVYTFCKKTHDEIASKNMSSDRKNEIYEKAQKANAHIQNMCDSFRRIQEGNGNGNSDEFRSRLKEAGIHLNDEELLMYRDVIGSCLEQGDTLLESINTIIDAVKA